MCLNLVVKTELQAITKTEIETFGKTDSGPSRKLNLSLHRN